MNQIDMEARKKQAEGCGCNGCKTELDYIGMIETLRVRVADQERFIATLESGIHKENGVVLQLCAEIAQLRADAELAEEVIVEDDAELLRLRLECNDLRAENERLREALEAMDAKLEVESSFEEKGETYVAFYRVPAGPWHKILGLIRG